MTKTGKSILRELLNRAGDVNCEYAIEEAHDLFVIQYSEDLWLKELSTLVYEGFVTPTAVKITESGLEAIKHE